MNILFNKKIFKVYSLFFYSYIEKIIGLRIIVKHLALRSSQLNYRNILCSEYKYKERLK
jgi:hypothetical protein